MNPITRFFICFILTTLLFACGQTGKLYLPKSDTASTNAENTKMNPDKDAENDG